MENYTLAMPAFRPGSTPMTADALCTSWSAVSTPSAPVHLRSHDSVRIQPQVDAVPSLADGRDAVAGVSNHDATAKSGPPRGEPR